MLKISSYSYLDQSPPPPSDAEITAFNRHEPGCIVITPASFRIDLSRSWNSPFNTEAIRVFAEDFRRKVIGSKWYSYPTPPPEKYLVLEYIELSLYLHLHYVKQVFASSQKSLPERHGMLRNAARSTRKTRVRAIITDDI